MDAGRLAHVHTGGVTDRVLHFDIDSVIFDIVMLLTSHFMNFLSILSKLSSHLFEVLRIFLETVL